MTRTRTPAAALAAFLCLALVHGRAHPQRDQDPEPPKPKPAEPRPALADQAVARLANVKRGDVVHTVGDAALAVRLADSVGCETVAIDRPAALKAAKDLAAKNKVGKLVRFQTLDLTDLPLKKATVVAVNLDRKDHPKVLAQLKKLPAGTRLVVSGGLAGFKGGQSETYQTIVTVTVPILRKEKRIRNGMPVETVLTEYRTEQRAYEVKVTAYTTPLKVEKE